MKSHVSK